MILKTNLSKSKTELYKRLLKFIFGASKNKMLERRIREKQGN